MKTELNVIYLVGLVVFIAVAVGIALAGVARLWEKIIKKKDESL